VRNTLRSTLVAGLPLDEALDIADYLVRLQFQHGEYATANLATLDPKTGLLHMISAGHPGPLIHVPGDDVIDPFTTRGLPLGLRYLLGERQPVEERYLTDGALLAFFTDGVIEWQRDELSGYAQLIEAMRDPALRRAENRAFALRDAVIAGEHADDVAIMCVEFVAAQTRAGR
jgi:serine phosphatase RsbU (regulator of sigma subunit)